MPVERTVHHPGDRPGDRIEKLGRSLVQHGPAGDRVYLMKLAPEDAQDIVGRIRKLVDRHCYTKVFAKVPAGVRDVFEADGYRVEAKIPGLYTGGTEGLFMARYHSPERRQDPDAGRIREVLDAARKAAPEAADAEPADGVPALPAEIVCRPAGPEDCATMAALYGEVFASYPFPIDDPAYLRRTMAAEVIYSGVWRAGRPLALASAEMDRDHANAEMTDFATRPDARGRGYALLLLRRLEPRARKLGIRTFYTIARATSFAMNLTFARGGYAYAGTLIRNTWIAGRLESMNVWYREMPRQPGDAPPGAVPS